MTKQCKKVVYPPGDWHSHRCSRKATHGDYCKQHAPETIAARDAKAMSEWERKNAAWKQRCNEEAERDRRAAMFGELVAGLKFVHEGRSLFTNDSAFADECRRRAAELVAKAEGGAS